MPRRHWLAPRLPTALCSTTVRHQLRQNHVQVSGQGTQPLIFGQGFGVDLCAWHRVVPHFEAAYCIVQYDLAGWGRSDPALYDRARYTSLNAHADDLLDICHTLKLRDVYYVGHSAGAMIGLLAAIREPTLFRKLVLIGASPRYTDDPPYVGGFEREQLEQLVTALAKDHDAWCETMAPLVVNDSPDSELAAEMLGNFKRADPSVAHHFLSTVFASDHREDLHRLRTPSLILQADSDPFVPNSVASYMHQRIPGASLALIRARGGHYPHLGAPAEVCAAIRGFLQAS